MRSKGCKKMGWCTAKGNDCVANDDVNCSRSTNCLRRDRCTALEGRCLPPEDNNPAMWTTGAIITGLGLATVAVGGIMVGYTQAKCDKWIECGDSGPGFVG